MTAPQRPQASARARRIAGAALATSLALAGCSKEIVVETTFPDPVVPSMPLAAGVFYPDALQNYDYSEDLPNDIEWSFTLGEANTRMFDRALGALFDELQRVEQPGGDGEPFDRLDVVIEPTIDAFEFSLPRQSRSDQYAVWIRYNLALYEPDGQLIQKWPVSAYGQADSKLFGSGGAMEAAVVRAMRDAIANVVIGLPQQPKFRAVMFPEEQPPEQEATEELVAEPTPDTDTPADDDMEEEAPVEEPPAAETAAEEIQS